MRTVKVVVVLLNIALKLVNRSIAKREHQAMQAEQTLDLTEIELRNLSTLKYRLETL